MAVQNLAITAALDDGFGFATLTLDNTSTTCFFGDDGDQSRTFLRFLLTADLVGATIDSAILTGYMAGSAAVEIDVVGDDSDDPIAPTTWAALSGITQTTAKIKWTTLNQGAGDQTAPDIKTVIQELVDSYGPLNGEAIQFVLDPTAYTNTTVKELSAFEDTNTEARLVITYTASPQTSAIINGGGSITASVTKHLNQVLRPVSTTAAGSWDTGPTVAQNLHDYAGDDSDATWIEDTTA